MIQNVQAYVPSWPGKKQHAQSTAEIIEQCCPTVILDNPEHFFNQQWDEARRRFLNNRWNWNEDSLKESALLWVMSDVWPPDDFKGMFQAGCDLLSNAGVGWYAPNVAWTSYIYDRKDLQQLSPGIYEVPNTDSLCCMIRGDVVAAMPFIDYNVSFMWGMDFVAIATARLLGLKAVRDYRFDARHPNSTGYDIDKASQGMKEMLEGFSPELRKEIDYLMKRVDEIRKPLDAVVNPFRPDDRPLSELEKNQLESARRHKEKQHTNRKFV